MLESPFQSVADKPGAYENEPSFEFIKQVPTSFEETRVVSGQPGEHAVIARRLGKDWYLGAITNWSPRQVEIPLTFLGPRPIHRGNLRRRSGRGYGAQARDH